MKSVSLYFDYISPFAYLLHKQLPKLNPDAEVKQMPVLFAGLLKHWGQLGPVEVRAKKLFTYRHTTWLAEQLGIAFAVPQRHPFNPLPYLRLTLATNCAPAVIDAIYDAIWTTGADPASRDCWESMCSALQIDDADDRIADPAVKSELISNTDGAIRHGVFGVPTFRAGGELFWGLDSLAMLNDYLADERLFEDGRMARLDTIEDAATRR